MKNAVLNLNLFPLYTRHALLVVALKLNTNFDAKVMKGTRGAYIEVILFPRSVAHAEVILDNGDLQTNACNSKTIWCILILKIVYYSKKNVAVDL